MIKLSEESVIQIPIETGLVDFFSLVLFPAEAEIPAPTALTA